ncbi:MAG: NAD(P)-dependent oxidoreductase [bacterium]|nr:NAD(P)-dependent oxidoreductase [bacterium]MCP5068361.1 NAD(P)-dependent oxidoreductase [bacterium]
MGERVAFLCLGAMGYPMAGHLAAAGHEVVVYNRTKSRAETWVGENRGHLADTPADAARGARFVFCCSGNDDDLLEVAVPAIDVMDKDAIFVDHTTASAENARVLEARAAARGAGFVDAPVSGGEEGAKRGHLTVMAGGERTCFDSARPLIDAFARNATWMGPAGSGQLTKMVNQICIAGVIEGLSEGLAFAEVVGLDPRRVVEVISKGAAQSWQMDQRAETMIEGRFDFGFAVDWMRKDLEIALQEARRSGARLPLAALVDQLYASVQARGGGRLDTSSLVSLLREP